MKDIPTELGPVQQTLLIPLLGRAEETRRGGLLDDPKAVEIVERLDYDLDQWKGTRSLIGCSIRTRMFDEEVAAFLEAHPEGIVVELGCGLNTRYERLDNGIARWFELDFSDVMALRRQFFDDDKRRTTAPDQAAHHKRPQRCVSQFHLDVSSLKPMPHTAE